jgi:ABC-type nitrate/sulfonate/bicarbonate transport system substrate-binding protein
MFSQDHSMNRFRKISIVAGLAAATACAQIADAEPVAIRVDWTVLPQQFAPLIPVVPKYAPNLYRHYGKSYVVEPIRFQGGGATLTALAVGETHLSTLNPQALVLGIVNAKLDLRVIAQQISTEIPGHLHTWFWVKKDRIKTIDDLKGKVIGVNARASATDAAAEIVLSRHGLAPTRDYQLLEVAFPFQLAALEAGTIDAAVLVPPFNLDAEAAPTLKPLFSLGDAFGPLETSVLAGKADFIANNRAALVDFLEDNMRMRRWMLDPATRNDAIRLLSDVSKVPPEKYAGWVYSSKDYYYDPNARVDVKRLQKNIDDMKRANIVPAAIDVAPYVDLSLADEAAARVGK